MTTAEAPVRGGIGELAVYFLASSGESVGVESSAVV